MIPDGSTAAAAVAFATAIGLRIYFVQGLREGAVYLANIRVVLLDTALEVEQVASAVDVALARAAERGSFLDDDIDDRD